MAFRPIPKQHLIVIVSCLAVVVLACGFGLWAGVYRFKSEAPIVRALGSGLPVARVGEERVSYAEYLEHVDAQAAYFSSEAAQSIGLARALNEDDRRIALERAIRSTAVELAAKGAGIVVTELDVERAYDAMALQASTSSAPGEFVEILESMLGMTPADFKRLVVRPAVLEDALRARRLTETGDATAFSKELEAKLAGADVKRYLTFETAESLAPIADY